MPDYDYCYQDLLDFAKEKGWKVKHVNRTPGWATFYPWGKIHIARQNRNPRKCYMLAHEVGHLVDYIRGGFPAWYEGIYSDLALESVNRWIPKSYIRKYEWSAVKFAKKIFKMYKLPLKNILDFKKNFFEKELLPLWIANYNNVSVKEVEKRYEKTKKH